MTTMNPAPYPLFDGSQPCASTDLEAHFPDASANGATVATARNNCRACDYRTECRDYAITHMVDGIWGDTTPNERRKIRSQLGIVPVALLPIDMPRKDVA